MNTCTHHEAGEPIQEGRAAKPEPPRRRLLTILVLVVAVAAGVWLLRGPLGDAYNFVANLNVQTFHHIVDGFGAWAPLVSVALMVAHGLVPFPVEILAVANGIAFGPWLGFALTWVGMVLASWLGYAIARLVRPLALRLVGPRRLIRVERRAAHGTWWELVALRQVPFISFCLLNFALGLLGIPFRKFAWTTAVGIVPSIALTILAGQALSAGFWALSIIGVILLVLILARHFRRKGHTPRRTRVR